MAAAKRVSASDRSTAASGSCRARMEMLEPRLLLDAGWVKGLIPGTAGSAGLARDDLSVVAAARAWVDPRVGRAGTAARCTAR